MKNKFPNASIVIATFNNAPILRRVLEAMLKLEYPAQYEIIVADDGSKDGTREMLQSNFRNNKKIKLIFLKHGGVCKARNAGIKAARFPIVINMDHDCIPSRNWLRDMAGGFDSEKIGIVSAYDYYGGTSTAFRKNLLNKVGGYDEDYVYYREDTDLSFKIMDLGYEFKLVKANYVHDHKLAKPKGFMGLAKHVMQRLKYHQNDVLLYKKHPAKLCEKFLNIKFHFLVSPLSDFKAATGIWGKGVGFSISSPRGIVFLENKSPLHALAIILAGIAYVCAVKISRLIGSIRFGKLLI
ncbi:MAG: glycosyltransferase family 2 protein [Candidatus Diapherotrites archaeon]|nr:glycosyltransferase family 2 protein [Candidatus Diapherotrites archaeon]